jgi:hypothetical protein
MLRPERVTVPCARATKPHGQSMASRQHEPARRRGPSPVRAPRFNLPLGRRGRRVPMRRLRRPVLGARGRRSSKRPREQAGSKGVGADASAALTRVSSHAKAGAAHRVASAEGRDARLGPAAPTWLLVQGLVPEWLTLRRGGLASAYTGRAFYGLHDLPRVRPRGAPGSQEGSRDDGPPDLHRECTSGHAWHLPLVIKPETRPAPCDASRRPDAP